MKTCLRTSSEKSHNKYQCWRGLSKYSWCGLKLVIVFNMKFPFQFCLFSPTLGVNSCFYSGGTLTKDISVNVNRYGVFPTSKLRFIVNKVAPKLDTVSVIYVLGRQLLLISAMINHVEQGASVWYFCRLININIFCRVLYHVFSCNFNKLILTSRFVTFGNKCRHQV